jgi:hypothetical protein
MRAFGLSWVAALALLVPVTAAAGIYRWTDESGTTVFSDTPPAKSTKVKNVQLVVQDDLQAKDTDEARARRREQELEQRIARLEREVQAMQYAPAQYQAPPAPPADYYAGGYPSYPPSYYPYYPTPYAYPYVVVVRPAHRFFAPRFAPRFASRPIAFRHGVMHARR